MMTMLSNAMFYTGGKELVLRKICQNTEVLSTVFSCLRTESMWKNTGLWKLVFWHIFLSVEFMLSINQIINNRWVKNANIQSFVVRIFPHSD